MRRQPPAGCYFGSRRLALSLPRPHANSSKPLWHGPDTHRNYPFFTHTTGRRRSVANMLSCNILRQQLANAPPGAKSRGDAEESRRIPRLRTAAGGFLSPRSPAMPPPAPRTSLPHWQPANDASMITDAKNIRGFFWVPLCQCPAARSLLPAACATPTTFEASSRILRTLGVKALPARLCGGRADVQQHKENAKALPRCAEKRHNEATTCAAPGEIRAARNNSQNLWR